VGLKRERLHLPGLRREGFRRTLVGLKLTASLAATRAFASFRRTLVGLKRQDGDTVTSETLFQTNPCGVEARGGRSGSRRPTCFRRTLVGLKRPMSFEISTASYRFQTNPCGVEAAVSSMSLLPSLSFQTNPCGVEADGFDHLAAKHRGFRRTLVGLKPRQPRHQRPRAHVDHGVGRPRNGSRLHPVKRRDGRSRDPQQTPVTPLSG